MKRRQIIGLVGSFAAAWPLAARAQQPERVRRIGVLLGSANQSYVTAFQGALTKLGWVEGSNGPKFAGVLVMRIQSGRSQKS